MVISINRILAKNQTETHMEMLKCLNWPGYNQNRKIIFIIKQWHLVTEYPSVIIINLSKFLADGIDNNGDTAEKEKKEYSPPKN